MKRSVLSLVAVLASSALISGQAMAATVPDKMKLVVETLHAAAQNCGVTEEGIKASARSSMRYNRISETDTMPYIYIQVTTMILPNGLCIYALNTEIISYTVSKPKGMKETLHNRVVLGSNSRVMTRLKNDNGGLYDAIKAGIDSSISEIVDQEAWPEEFTVPSPD